VKIRLSEEFSRQNIFTNVLPSYAEANGVKHKASNRNLNYTVAKGLTAFTVISNRRTFTRKEKTRWV